MLLFFCAVKRRLLMNKKGTRIIIFGFISIIIAFAIANIIEFRLIEFYSMLVMMFFLLKYVCIIKDE